VEYPPLEVFWLNDTSFNAGVEHQKIDEFVVRIYGREKTIADCFKFRNKVGLDLAIEALKSYMAERPRDINALMKYARINRVERVLRPYVEALV
jgi:predicted transcriptional regulator of viral defense system